MELRGFTVHIVKDLGGRPYSVAEREVYLVDTGDDDSNRRAAEEAIRRYKEAFTYRSGFSS